MTTDTPRPYTARRFPGLPAYDAWEPPTAADIAAASGRAGLGLTVEQVELFAGMAPAFRDPHERAARAWLEFRPLPRAIPSAPGRDEWNAIAYQVDVKGAPEGPLAGMSIAVKETISVGVGAPVGAGSPLVAGHRSPFVATIATRALDAGAAIEFLGRADGLCMGIRGMNGYAGPVINPWSSGHSTWGSSAGAAGLLGAGVVDAALHVCQAGSGMVVAAGTNAVSYKATRGLIPTTGVIGFHPLLDRITVSAREVRAVALLASVISGGDGVDLLQGPHCEPVDLVSDLTGNVKGLRIGVVTESLTTGPDGQCEKAVADAVRAQAAELAGLCGTELREVSIPDYTLAADVTMLLTLHAGVPMLLAGQLGTSPIIADGDPRLVRHFAQARAEHPELLADTVQLSASTAGFNGGQPDGYWGAVAQGLLPRLNAAFTAPFTTGGADEVDMYVTPTTFNTPPSLTEELTPEETLAADLGPGIRHTATNWSGMPVVQVPLPFVNGLPAGMQLTALHNRDLVLLDAAYALQPAGGYEAAPLTPHHHQETPSP